MKVYILTCINEGSELVYVKAFREHFSARAEMLAQLHKMVDVLVIEGHFDYQVIHESSAAIGDDSFYYAWKITEDEI